MWRRERGGTGRWSSPLSRAVVVTVLGLSSLSTASAYAGQCPNEALRTELHSGQLPDCRAYELVSPAYKQGAFVSPFAVLTNGTRIIAGSVGAFGGTEGDALGQGTNLPGAAYEFVRDEQAGWTTASLGPPAAQFRSNGMFDASADLGATLWELGRRRVASVGASEEEARCPAQPGEEEIQPEGVTDFYVEPSLGTFARVGPPTPDPCEINASEYTYLGASEDLSRILFSTGGGFRWPFDGTVKSGPTLYEYTGVEQPGEAREPTLVGVQGGLGSRTLISSCGTRLGSGAPEVRTLGSMYNAVSSSGARVFFTAVGTDEAEGCEGPPVSEMFAREEEHSGEVHTVAISEPSISYCAGTPSPPCADANFEGASADGSKVFFTSTQSIPGVEGASEDEGSDSAVKGCTLTTGPGGCNLYEYEFEPAGAHRLILVSGGSTELGGARVQGVVRVSEDGSHVYFVAEGVLTGASTNAVGNRAVAGADNLYSYAEGHTAFVATLASGDSSEWSRIDSRPVLVSTDGGILVFTSIGDLTNEGVTGAKSQVYQYDAATGALVRVSIGQNGYNDDGKAPAAGATIVNGFPFGYSYSGTDSPAARNSVQAPADGAVFFSSSDALTPQALNDQSNFLGKPVINIYEYRAGQVYLLSDGRDASAVNAGPGVYLVGSDPSGGDVFFLTADSLSASDGDTQQDLYDARVEGGFPRMAAGQDCSGEACQGPLVGAPALAPLGGSATQVAEDEESVAVVGIKIKPKPKVTKAKKKPKAVEIKKRRKAKARKAVARVGSKGHKDGRGVR